MTQPSGWYEDPQDPSQLRYWDGVVWSSHVTPKVSPTVEQSNIGMPYGVTPAAARPHAPGSQGAQGPSAQQEHGQQGGHGPAYGQPSGRLGQQTLGRALGSPTTPDGAVLSGWWRRVLARLIDLVIVSILALPLMFDPLKRASAILGDYFQESWAAGLAGSSTMPVLNEAELNEPMQQVVLIMLAVSLVYEVAFLSRTGATIGKMAVGISVRLRNQPGPPPMKAVLGRSVCYFGFQLFPLLPLPDVLWPLWDDKRQAIHDKVGATNVVVGRQPRRGA